MANINIDKEILERVKTKIPIKLRNPNLRLNNVRVKSMTIESAEFNLLDDKAVFLPEQKVYDVYKNCNNSSERRGWTETLTLNKTVTTSKTVTFSKTISSKFDVKANVSFPKVGGASAGYSKSISVTNSKTWSESQTITENRSRTIDTRVKEFSVLFIKLEKTIYSVRVPFECTLEVEGVIEATYTGTRTMRVLGTKIKIPYQIIKKHRISDLLEKANTVFKTSGFIENSSADQLSVSYFERDYDSEVDKCENFEIDKELESELKILNEESDKEIIDDNNQEYLIKQLEDGNIIEDENIISKLDFSETIEEYFGSITITTSNSYATIMVRHLSFGPGGCSVTSNSSLGSSVSHIAPPAFWSDWYLLEQHAGVISITITDTVNCDTGVRSEVKYWK
jgi:hypothetical protein